MATDRAKTGGEQGMNGMWYRGGEFLPHTDLPKMTPAERRAAKPRKVEVEPYKWVLAPTPDSRAIYGLAGTILVLWQGKMTVCSHQETLDYFHTSRELAQQLADAYNKGQRWYTVR